MINNSYIKTNKQLKINTSNEFTTVDTGEVNGNKKPVNIIFKKIDPSSNKTTKNKFINYSPSTKTNDSQNKSLFNPSKKIKTNRLTNKIPGTNKLKLFDFIDCSTPKETGISLNKTPKKPNINSSTQSIEKINKNNKMIKNVNNHSKKILTIEELLNNNVDVKHLQEEMLKIFSNKI